ncbi:PssD/Cps14F family polysaccharide biosynthesis glycosyltransferase [Thermococcus sp. Bubb.Bath]|uniref:PssD/Cps14F family polysaccharide biosynthesis glycosyltransferase n=1 Tax=Thermococcus sp. Bubb.Bath TaxID=1638242 RepID=UPI0014387CBC|nr:PssD/Cps14F family polysaccharide biosynthesis glycosyltransferase [Thermococcus sp. Bubb.Bath]NJF25149.1 capsular biosynthesis protein [Thermococcus sp. Bubb.Bath]
MKIALVCSHGGHLTEILYLMDAFKDHDVFFITYDNFRTRELSYEKYLLENIGTSPIKMLKAFFQIGIILAKEKPKVIISTGSEIAIPTFIIAKFLGIKTVFIESWCRIKTKSGTGKIVYYLSDLFLVQWPQLLKLYGSRAKYMGAVV